jgi:hypothetical protein
VPSSRNKILSTDELEYIRQLEAADSGRKPEDDVGGWLRVSEDAAGLLDGFSESPLIELQAGWQGHRLRFPLKPRTRSDNGELTLEIGVPEVLEGGDRSRSWRVPPGTDEMQLQDKSGKLEKPQVVNLSYTGMAIEQRADRLPDLNQPLRDLRLVLPGQGEYLRLLGYVVRHMRLDDQRIQLGIRFDPLSEDCRDRLGRYILQRHKELQAVQSCRNCTGEV